MEECGGGWNTYGYASITKTYAVGKVKGVTDIGGLVGSIWDDTCKATNSYYDTETTGQETSAVGTGLTTEKMKLQSSYSNWDFTTIWKLEEGKYPALQ